MPTAGTHITIIERLGLDAEFAPLLGDPNADDFDDAAALRMRFAKLGAIGPDLFYAMADYGPELQDIVNFLSKLAGSLQCVFDVMGKIDDKLKDIESGITLGASDEFRRALDEISELFTLVSATIGDGLMAAVINNGVNFWPTFEARRQQDMARPTWFWADYLHYVRSGEFARTLLNLARGNEYHTAYALGYLSHYVTDVVGHPYVNMVVGAPWRAYWQRHHLVENYIDAYVWDRWHRTRPMIDPNGRGEPPLDEVLDIPNGSPGQGAPMTFSRLNDHINIGVNRGNDPVDRLIADICERIDQGLEDIGLAEPNPEPPTAAEFVAWTKMMEAAFRAAYPAGSQPPENLRGGSRADGYPTADDVAAAYSLLRLFLRTTTEQKLREPQFPNVAADVWDAVKQMFDDLVTDLGQVPPFPLPQVRGGFSLSSLWESICDWVVRIAQFAIALGKAAIDLIRNAIHVGGVLLVDMIKMGLYLVKKALFDLYEAFHHYLVRAAYALPRTGELGGDVAGGVPARSLWTTAATDDPYPAAEIPALEEPRLGSHYAPWIPIRQLDEMRGADGWIAERPRTWAGPYGRSTPDDFIDGPLGVRELLSPNGPIDASAPPQWAEAPDDHFGGAMDNCRAAFRSVLEALESGEVPEGRLPDYNLDGDRGYAWPCWDVDRDGHPDKARLHPDRQGSSLEVAAVAIG